MSGTYRAPKDTKWHTPGKADPSPEPSKPVLVDGNNNPTKIGIEALDKGDVGEDTRGEDQMNPSAVSKEDRTPPASATREQQAPNAPVRLRTH